MNAQTAYTRNYWQGSKYDGTHRSTKDVTADVRKEVNAKYPRKAGYRISVSFESFSGGSSINLSVKAAPFKIFRPEYSAAYKQMKETNSCAAVEAWREKFWDSLRAEGKYDHREYSAEYTEQAMALVKDLERIANQYNYSDCDGMIDYFNVNYYVHSGIYWETDKDL